VPSLDDWLADYDVVERHEAAAAGPPEHVLAAALAMPAAPDAVVRTLFRARGLPRAETLEQFFRRMRFEELERTPTALVLGSSGRPWRPRGGLRPFAEQRPGTVRMAFVLAAEPGRLWTETRVAAVDEAARRAFLRYWRVVGPCSALIRRRWLRAATR